jgi:predicted porin
MKARLIALAALAAMAGAASAQSNITIYGVVDAGVAYTNNGNPAGNTWALASGQESGSRLGFRGREDLGSGLSAIFTLENGFNVDTGTLGQSTATTSRLFGRQAWVGLDSPFGSLKLGRQQTELYTALNVIDPFGINLAGNAQRVFGYGTYGTDPLQRTDNTISYTTPNFAGLSGSVSYGFGEVPGNMSASRNVGAGASYINGPINVQLVYRKANTVTSPAVFGGTVGDERTTFVGATYDFGIAKAHAAFADSRLPSATTDGKDRNYMLGVSAPLGAGRVLASWNRNDFRDIDAGRSNQYAIGYTYAFSKRTDFYTSYGYTRNDSGVALSTFNNNVAGANVKFFNAGVRHQF